MVVCRKVSFVDDYLMTRYLLNEYLYNIYVTYNIIKAPPPLLNIFDNLAATPLACKFIHPVDLKTRKSTGTSCQIEIHF